MRFFSKFFVILLFSSFNLRYQCDQISSFHFGGVAVLDYDTVVSKFELQSGYYIHFRSNTFGKGINPLSPPAMG